MLIVDKRKGEVMPIHEVIPTPSVGLNRALNGGLNSGATHLFWGTPSVGKTTMCFRIIAEPLMTLQVSIDLYMTTCFC